MQNGHWLLTKYAYYQKFYLVTRQQYTAVYSANYITLFPEQHFQAAGPDCNIHYVQILPIWCYRPTQMTQPVGL